MELGVRMTSVTPYERGFLSKCAEYGVDDRAALEPAASRHR